jgi:mono/diheme cytochrome c family protein
MCRRIFDVNDAGCTRRLLLAGWLAVAACLAVGCEPPKLSPSATGSTSATPAPSDASSVPAPPSDAIADAATGRELPPEAPPAADLAPPVVEDAAPAEQAPAEQVAAEQAPAEQAPADSLAMGPALFEQHGCQRCHRLDDAGGPGPGGPRGRGPRGPSLAHVGANPEHTADWIAEHIRDPKAHNPRSRMPAFGDKMSEEELRQLAEYLATLQ